MQSIAGRAEGGATNATVVKQAGLRLPSDWLRA